MPRGVVDITEKTIAIRINEEFHKKIKIKLAENGLTLKDYIISLIEKDINSVPPKKVFTKQDIIDNVDEIVKLLNKNANK